ncbi:MAG: N-acetylmuramoyl-L-alanine amidase [Pseudomonadota bacterium]
MPMNRYLAATVLLLFSALLHAQSEINGVRMWPAPDSTRVVFDASGEVEHSLFSLDNPDRIVIDVKNARLRADTDKLDFDKGVLKGIRTGKKGKGDLRIVLDLSEAVEPKSFALRPNEKYGHRLVVDLAHDENRVREKKSLSSYNAVAARDIIVAIDAGHGGEDPGAIGPNKTHEKDVVLAIARRLAALLKKEKGFKPVLIRDGDYYIGLSQRVELARKYKADLMVSIHADSFRDHRASGSSVYTLSRRGATSEQARLLAEKENASDLIGGVTLEDKDNLLASVLLDLSQTASIEASTDVAARVLQGLKTVGKVHKRQVEQAGFRVLKAPDMPSILVEAAFISNPGEERRLRNANHQYRLAKAMREGILNYFQDNPPPGTLLARSQRKHVIARGETLSGIAHSYRVNTDTLKRYNGLQDTTLRVGQVLRIPSDS